MFPPNVSEMLLPIQKAKYNMAQRVIFSKVSADIPGAMGIGFSKINNFHIEITLEPIVWRSYQGSGMCSLQMFFN